MATRVVILFGLLVVLAPVQAHADGWAISSKHDAMKNFLIVDVGEVSEVEPPINTKWVSDVYQMNGRCFTFFGYMGYWGYGSKAALLLANQQKDIKLALIESSVGSIKADLQPITIVNCPAGTNIIPYSDDPEERLRLLEKRQDELKKKLEKMQRQK